MVIQRYDSDAIKNSEDGRWVEYSDHAAIVAEHVSVKLELAQKLSQYIDACASHEAVERELLYALKNLYALVNGECPSVLEDDHHDTMVRVAIENAESRRNKVKGTKP